MRKNVVLWDDGIENGRYKALVDGGVTVMRTRLSVSERLAYKRRAKNYIDGLAVIERRGEAQQIIYDKRRSEINEVFFRYALRVRAR